MSRLWLSGYRSYELNVFGDQDDKLKVIKFALTNYLTTQIEDGMDWLIGTMVIVVKGRLTNTAMVN
ncbi:hypothetical protein IMAU10574_00817 [Lactiplantibacillus plantarum]|nr:hypothetical protein [Lactiplantibacillus plantarum]